MYRLPWALPLRFIFAILFFGYLPVTGVLAGPTVGTVTSMPTTTAELLAKAIPDECFNGIGNPYPPGPPCAAGVPKVNQAYVWGLTRSGSDLWFGTMSNTQCLVLSTYMGIVTPLQNDSYVCEFGSSRFVPPLPAALGDLRPPRIYVYDTAARALIPKTPADPRIAATVGLRAAGNNNNVVLLAGPNLAGGLNLFAFRADTRAYLGSTTLAAYNNIRKFLLVDGVLYVGVGKSAGGGNVLRWTGSVATPFTFDVVGNLDAFGSELAVHEGRLFVSTWPSTIGGPLAGLYMSPVVPASGLTTANAASWTKVWKANDYEPDPVTAATYGGGALASYGGYLYWGTMHVPLVSTQAHISTYSLPTSDKALMLQTYLQSERAISIFRGSGFNSSPVIDLVYGMPTLPKYTAPSGWAMVPNNMNKSPLWGPSGFGNPYNNYTWTMEVFDGRLYVGTMDYSYLFKDLLQPLLGSSVTLPANIQPAGYGADLFYFPSAQSPAFPESINGIDNFTSYGIRSMVTGPSSLFLGMANPMNLLTDTTDGLPEGGWELIELKSKPVNTPVGNNVQVNLDGGISVNFCSVSQAGYTAGFEVPNNLNLGIIPSFPLSQPASFFGIGSTALWRGQPCAGGRLALVCVPAGAAGAGSFLTQLQFNAQTGSFQWVDITTSNSDGQLCGAIDQNFIGSLAVMQPIPAIPTLSTWALLFLLSTLMLAGLIHLRKIQSVPASGSRR